MKKYYIIVIVLLHSLLIGCTGSFEKDLFAINLTYPEPNSSCERGELSSSGIVIPFEWEPQGQINNFQLILNGESIEANPTILDNGKLEFKVPVQFNTNYTWQIKSPEADSDIQEFRTPSSDPNDNNVPLAVLFNPNVIVSNQTSSTNITVSWTGSDQENDGLLRYDAYWSTDENISPENNLDKDENLPDPTVTFPIANFDANTNYYILVVARDGQNAAYSILKYCQLCGD